MFLPVGWFIPTDFLYARHGHALTGESSKHAQEVGSVYLNSKGMTVADVAADVKKEIDAE